MSLNLLIIEDNVSLLIELRMELEKMDVNIHSETTEGGALVRLSEELPDLALLDLMLGNSETGPAFAEKLNRMGVPFIVMTQFRQEEIYNEVTRFKPMAYYTKPIDYVSLRYQITKLISQRDDAFLTLSVKWKDTFIRLPLSDIDYIQGEGNYVTVYTTSGSKYVLRKSLKKLMIDLPKKQFIRVHRNYVVQIKNVCSYSLKDNFILIDKIKIPLGRSYRPDIRKRLS